MINYNNYSNAGFGLSEIALKQLTTIIDSIEKSNINVVEFGSGISTRFLVDLNSVIEKNLVITSFDNDPNYAYKGKGANLLMRNLIECDDKSYEKMMSSKQYDSSLMHKKVSKLHTRQKNNFYDVQKGDLSGTYDLMILDGPNGNGRNISYLHMKEHLKSGSVVLIDDYDHYDFVQRFNYFFDADVIFEHNQGRDKVIILKLK